MSNTENEDVIEFADPDIVNWRKDVSLALIQTMDSNGISALIKQLESVVFNPHKHTGK